MNRLAVVGRIAGQPIYTPAINVNGKIINAKCEMTIIENDRDKKNAFRVTGWGGQADNMAKGGAVGKAITVFGRLGTYKGRVWLDFGNGNRQPVQSPQGGDYLTTKTGITLERLDWGADSGKNIAQEIQDFQNHNGAKGRPAQWQTPGHPDNVIWKNICAARKATTYNPGDTHFGYAEVRIPNGAQIAPPKTNNGNGNQYANNGQGHQGSFQGNNGNNNNQPVSNNAGNANYQTNGGYQTSAPQSNNGQLVNNNGQVNYQGQNIGNAYTGTAQHQGNASQVNSGFQGNTNGNQNPPTQNVNGQNMNAQMAHQSNVQM